jgi:hypothetical protein
MMSASALNNISTTGKMIVASVIPNDGGPFDVLVLGFRGRGIDPGVGRDTDRYDSGDQDRQQRAAEDDRRDGHHDAQREGRAELGVHGGDRDQRAGVRRDQAVQVDFPHPETPINSSTGSWPGDASIRDTILGFPAQRASFAHLTSATDSSLSCAAPRRSAGISDTSLSAARTGATSQWTCPTCRGVR